MVFYFVPSFLDKKGHFTPIGRRFILVFISYDNHSKNVVFYSPKTPFHESDLDLNPVTLTLKLDLDIVHPFFSSGYNF